MLEIEKRNRSRNEWDWVWTGFWKTGKYFGKIQKKIKNSKNLKVPTNTKKEKKNRKKKGDLDASRQDKIWNINPNFGKNNFEKQANLRKCPINYQIHLKNGAR